MLRRAVARASDDTAWFCMPVNITTMTIRITQQNLDSFPIKAFCLSATFDSPSEVNVIAYTYLFHILIFYVFTQCPFYTRSVKSLPRTMFFIRLYYLLISNCYLLFASRASSLSEAHYGSAFLTTLSQYIVSYPLSSELLPVFFTLHVR